MDKQNIINEGFLEALITDDVDESTRIEIEKQISKDSELRSVYYAIEKKIELLAFYYQQTPHPTTKQKLMENPAIMNSHMALENNEVTGFSWLSIAASLITVGSMILSIYFWNQWQSTDKELTDLVDEKAVIANRYLQVNEQLQDIKSDIAILVSPSFARLILKGTDNASDAEAVIYWNEKEETILINSASLAELKTSQQYQLWALLDGKPIDAGVFDAKSGQFQAMKGIASADAFAITIEPKGGSTLPSLETMQVYGESI